MYSAGEAGEEIVAAGFGDRNACLAKDNMVTFDLTNRRHVSFQHADGEASMPGPR